MHRRRSFASKFRSSRGSVIVEGAIAMCMVLSSSLAAGLLLVDTGCLIYFKTKLTHVNYLTAAYAAAHDGDSNLEQETASYAQSMMTQMGLATKNLTVTVKPVQMAENSGVQVILANDFAIPGFASADAPSAFKLVDTEFASH